MRKLILTLLIAFCVLSSQKIQAQEDTYRFDFGGQVGMAGYLGDASSSIFSKPGVAAGLSFRYLPDVRWTLRTVFNVLSISGDTKNLDDVFPGGENYSFSSTVFDLGERLEFNFFPYGIGETYKRLRRWTPYLAVGLGFTLASCEGESAFAVNIPMAFGVKYKLSKRWNLSGEFSMTKVFSDHVDGPLSDLHQIKSSFARNTDWYSNFSISITYEFGERCTTCHYVD